MAAGLPVVVGTDLPEIRDFVHDHEVGVAVDLNPGRIAAAAGTLLKNRSLRRKMGERARKLVAEQFTWDRAVNEVEEVLKSCVSR